MSGPRSRQFGGFIARYVGDGVLIYFGWPEAREADAERAVRAGLAVAAAVSAARLFAANRCRFASASQRDLWSSANRSAPVNSRQQTAVGETPNLAARLQAPCRAEPGGDRRRHPPSDRRPVRLPRARAETDEGLCRTRSMSGPWCGESAVEGRFAAFHPNTLCAAHRSRRRTRGSCVRRWHQAKAGEGQMVLIAGRAWHRQVAPDRRTGRPAATASHTWACATSARRTIRTARCTRSSRAGSAELGFARGDTPEDKLRKFEALLEPTGTSVEDMALIADLLGIPSDGRYAPLMFSPQQKKTKTLERTRAPPDQPYARTTCADVVRGRSLGRSKLA